MREDGKVQRRLVAGAFAGLVGGASFLACMRADMALTGRKVDDLRLLADWGPTRKRWKAAGLAIHGLNSVLVGATYAAVEHRLRGPGWLRGTTFALAENCALYPVLLVLDRVHPAIVEGRLPQFSHPWPFAMETWRHMAYGLTLGLLFPRILRRI
jgi:hypothetical protein